MLYYAVSRREKDKPTVGARIGAGTQQTGDKKMNKVNGVAGAGFVKKDRMADQVETDAIVKALESFGVNDAENYAYHLFGQYDAPYGWYLFGVSPIEELCNRETFPDMQGEKYLILGDCLDVLPDYGKLLTLADVVNFAWNQDKDGAYDAIQEWGVFSSITYKMSCMLDDNDVCVEEEHAKWDAKRGEWRLVWSVMYTTDIGAEEKTEISIPACMNSRGDADAEFASEWLAYMKAFDADTEARNYSDSDEDVSMQFALDWAESKERAISRINELLQEFMTFGNTVWVLTIRYEGETCPEVHKTFDGAIEGARTDFLSNDDVKEEDWDMVREKLESQRYFYHEEYAVEYDITECLVCE